MILNRQFAFVTTILCVELLVISYLFLFNWDAGWMHSEMSMYFQNAVHNGKGLHWRDFILSLDWIHFDGAPRARFLSNYLLIINSKLRFLLLQYFPLHPSISLNWIYPLILSPVFLYKLTKNLTNNQISALIVVAIFTACESSLASINMLYHPAKPLTNFLYIFSMWLASLSFLRIQNGLKPKYSILIALSLTIFIACFVDESDFFLFALIPIIFPRLFLQKGWQNPIYLLLAFGVLFLITVTYIAPVIIEIYGVGKFNFWSWSLGSNNRIRSLSFEPFALNFIYLLWNHIVPFKSEYGAFNFSKLVLSILAVVVIFLIYCFQKQPKSDKKLILLFGIGLIAFTIFQSLLLTRHLSVIKDAYYYGGPFSVLFSLTLGVLLSPISSGNFEAKFTNFIKMVIFIFILFTLLHNYYYANNAWRGKRHDQPTVNHSYINSFWSRRDDLDYLNSIGPTVLPDRFRAQITEIITSVLPAPRPWVTPLSPYLDPSIHQK